MSNAINALDDPSRLDDSKNGLHNFSHIKKDWKWESQPLKDLFHKWNLTPDLVVAKFRVKEKFRVIDETEVIRAFFESENFNSVSGFSLRDRCDRKNFAPGEIKIMPLNCEETNMNFLEPLFREGIISDTGYILGCFDEEFDGILVQDKLREMLANPYSEYNSVFSDKEKSEFLYHILRLICLGGSLCQSEDRFNELKNAIKIMYKELVSVKQSTSGKIEVTSTVYQIDPISEKKILFPCQSVHNRCYCVIDQETQLITLILKPFIPSW